VTTNKGARRQSTQRFLRGFLRDLCGLCGKNSCPLVPVTTNATPQVQAKNKDFTWQVLPPQPFDATPWPSPPGQAGQALEGIVISAVVSALDELAL